VLGLNERSIQVEDIHIFWDRKRLASKEELQKLLVAINTEGEQVRAVDLALGALERVA
jgi:hypothetical protein